MSLGPRSRYDTVHERNDEVRKMLDAAISSAVSHPGHQSTTTPALVGLIPTRAALEAAAVLVTFMVAEGHPLDLIDPRAGDLSPNRRRLAGDRTCSEHLSRELVAIGVPCTQGVFRSSTYRTSYVAEGAATTSLNDFVRWAASDQRTTHEIADAQRFIFGALVAARLQVPALPELSLSQMTFASTRRWADLVLAIPSRGACAQYLVAALLEAEHRRIGSGLTVHTKRALASDASSRTGGDIEIRRRTRVIAVVEVSQGPWHAKLEQAVRAAWHADIDDVLLLARAQTLSGATLRTAIERATRGIEAARDVLDVRVLNLDDEIASLIGRLDRSDRHFAIRRLDGHLRRYELDRSPHLVEQVVEAAVAAGLANSG